MTDLPTRLREQAARREAVLDAIGDPETRAMAAQDEWKPIETLPGIMERPGRYFARFEGWQYHSGHKWARVWIDLVSTNPETQWGIPQDDVDRVMKRGGMDAIDAITHWCPMSALPTPPVTP